MLQLVTPASRARISHAVTQPPHEWRGSRKGVRMTIKLEQQPDLHNHRFSYRATFHQHTYQGVAGTVFDCIAQLETDINNQMRREARAAV